MHPQWDSVAHSSSGIAWWSNNGTGITDQKTPRQQQEQQLARMFQREEMKRSKDNLADSHLRNLQMWADWYMLLQAKTIYHTHSDFSNSAAHWMGSDSFIIDGYNATTGRLRLHREHWIRDGPCPALKDRTRDGSLSDHGRLQHCLLPVSSTTEGSAVQ
jgi:hypothetical protein